MSSVVSRGTCPDCKRPVLWGVLQNGRRRTFQPDPVRASEVNPREAYAARKGQPYLIDLEGIRVDPNLEVLTPHYCAEYRENRRMRNVESLGDMLPPPAS